MTRALGLLAVALLLTLAGCGSDRDTHAQAACDAMNEAAHAQLFDAVADELKAVHEAGLSDDDDLRAAATKTSPASQLDPTNPLYENPGDVQANAVSAWCDAHPK